jgi:hypothetical protein
LVVLGSLAHSIAASLVCLGACLGGCSGGSVAAPPGGAGDAGPTGQGDATTRGVPPEASSDGLLSGESAASDTGPKDAYDDVDGTLMAEASLQDATQMSSDATDAGGCAYGDAGEATDLKCTGLYSDWDTKTVSADVQPYDPGLHLWSDGATKTRWIYLPPGPGDAGRAPIDTSNMDEWTFPVGTKVWKEFVLGGKRIETRLLWKQAAYSWYLTTYRWSADESSATELTIGELDADGNGYEVPSQAECPACHGGRQDIVLGFEAVSLSSAGATPITMATLVDSGWITSAPEAGIVIPGNATDVAALAYLHTNCGIACHNRGSGAADGTGFFMRLDVAQLGSVQATDTWQTGVNQPGYFAPPGYSSPLIRLAPGDAGASCVYYRMSRRTGDDDAAPGIQMPPIDTHKVDEAGVAAILSWIDDGCQ